MRYSIPFLHGVQQVHIKDHLPLLRYCSVIALLILPPSYGKSTQNPRSRRRQNPIIEVECTCIFVADPAFRDPRPQTVAQMVALGSEIPRRCGHVLKNG